MIPVSPDDKPDTDPPAALNEGALRTVTFAGTVRDPGGAPAGGAIVYVSLYEFSPAPPASGPRATVRQTQTGAGGSFRLELPVREPSWSANVVAIRDDCGPGGQRVSSPIDALELELSLTRPSFVAGRVVDLAGHPVAGASVSIQWAAFPSHEAALLLPEEMRPPAVADAEGCFHLAPVPARCRVSL